MKRNIKDILETIDKDYLNLLFDIGKVSRTINQKSYLVGGMVRDLLLNHNNLDIDIVVENNAGLLAETLVKTFKNCELSAKHDRFHTAKIIFTVNNKKIPIDLASTRTETYEFPGALPDVKRAEELKEDLGRRDFTINALAVSLLPEDFGDIFDSFNGLEDLKSKKIRVVPNENIFTDDPTRMIRAIRFATKFGFEIEKNTRELLDKTIKSGQFDNLIEKIRGDRVKIEIKYLFNLPNIEKAIKIFFESGVYRIVNSSIKNSCRHITCNMPTTGIVLDQWLIYLAFIIKDLNTNIQEEIMKNLQMTNNEIKIISSGFNAYKALAENRNLDGTFVYKLLKGLSPESIEIVKKLCKDIACNASLVDEYLERTSKIKLEISGQDLISMGIPSGKKIGEIMDKILELKIKNPKMTKEDELKEVKRFI